MSTNLNELDQLRHSCAHLLAAAVMDLWPNAKRTIGPAIDTGFYYDFDFGDDNISEKDLPKIEKKMRQLVNKWQSFEKVELEPEEAKKQVKDNPYKQELIEEFSKEGKSITFYKSGDFQDLCRGGHIDNPKEELKHFKLLSLAGAYWRGDEKNKMLTRIYGTAFASKEELDQYLWQLEEAKKRDHKILGPKLDLFTFSDIVGSGLPLWTPKGTLLRNLLDDFVQDLRKEKGYSKVEIPHITKKDLYETSGHWDKFEDELFKITTRENHQFAMKPMNCPHHTQIYARRSHSYRELPQRYANTTMVYRDEQSGELAGLSRVRCITQDDAHVFCRESQLEKEVVSIWEIIKQFYAGTGFPELEIRLSLHDPDNFQNYLGTKEVWQKSEEQLRSILNAHEAKFYEAKGEAAFYGPKIDFMAKDSIGREWQVATIQADRNMPERFDLYCINEKGDKERIIMLHAAIMGAIERFMSILIEHFAGAFPVWLAPVQAVVIPISADQEDYADKVLTELSASEVRAEVWSEGSMAKRIRLAEKQKIPYMLVVGDKEKSNNSVSLRVRGQEDRGEVKLDKFQEQIQKTITTKSLED